jgi:hypothetical protein
MQQYQLKQSSALNRFTIALYCLAIMAIGIFLHGMILLSGALIVLASLLLFRDQCRYRLLKSRDPTLVTLHDSTDMVELNQLGDRLQFEHFRLFSNRWFLILQMKNQQVNKNVMLVSDRFNTINEYLRFRYSIINMCRNQHAA